MSGNRSERLSRRTTDAVPPDRPATLPRRLGKCQSGTALPIVIQSAAQAAGIRQATTGREYDFGPTI
jgi:hypothetical protein